MSKSDSQVLQEFAELYRSYLDLDQTRTFWYSLFDPSSDLDEVSKEKIVQDIRQRSMKFGDIVHKDVYADYSDEIFVRSSRGVIDLRPNSFLKIEKAVEEYPKENLPGKYLLVGTLVSGLPYSALIDAYLRKIGKSLGFALLSNCRKGHESKFENGKKVPRGLYVPESEQKIIESNINNPVLVIDENVSSGETLKTVDKYLNFLGCKERFYLIGSGTIHGSDGLQSPFLFNKVEELCLSPSKRRKGKVLSYEWRFY